MRKEHMQTNALLFHDCDKNFEVALQQHFTEVSCEWFEI